MSEIKWTPVTSIEQVKTGTLLKIVAISEKNNYLDGVTVKRLVECNGDIEVIINLKKNYYFNLNAYLEGRSMWGKWVKEVYFS
jgi:hypothetical protein